MGGLAVAGRDQRLNFYLPDYFWANSPIAKNPSSKIIIRLVGYDAVNLQLQSKLIANLVDSDF